MPPTLRPVPSPRPLLLALLPALLLPGPLSGQAVTVDEGSFTVTRDGQPMGREQFRIIRRVSGGNVVYVANATAAYGDRRLSPALETDTAGAPLAYVVEVRTGAELQEKLSGRIGRGRFSARMQSPRGESGKEYIVADGALILDEDVFHQYYFLADRVGAVPVVVPRRNVQMAMRVEPKGDATVVIGGRSLPARHMTLTAADGSTRDIWLDAEGRVLKVAIPARGVLAVRDDPPR